MKMMTGIGGPRLHLVRTAAVRRADAERRQQLAANPSAHPASKAEEPATSEPTEAGPTPATAKTAASQPHAETKGKRRSAPKRTTAAAQGRPAAKEKEGRRHKAGSENSAPKAKSQAPAREGTKKETVLALLRRSQGATLAEMMKATGWQSHSVRGFLSGTLRKKMSLKVKSGKRENGERVYSVRS